MSLPSPAASPGAPLSATAETWARLKAGAGWRLLVVGSLCLGIAVILAVLQGRGLYTNLVYSLAIGSVCSLTVDATRLFSAWLTDWRGKGNTGLSVQEADRAAGWRGAIPGALLAVLFGPPVGMWLGDHVTGFRSPSALDFADTGTRVTLAFSVVATIICVTVLSTLERLASARAQAEAAQRQAAEHQLRLLQSQLEPHMLFNTLANLRVLIGLDTARAQGMLDHLIAYLRATLNASRTAEHPLATEFERLADYLALMGVRMGPRLQVELDLPADLRNLPVPPLLLQPLVENAIQHGLEPHVQGGCIRVSAALEGNMLVLTVRDTGRGLPDPGHAPAAGTGFGLAQVRERLATLHGSQASLSLQDADDGQGGTRAVVRLPCKPASLGSKP